MIHVTVPRGKTKYSLVSCLLSKKIRVGRLEKDFYAPFEKGGHIALHLSVSMSVGRYVGSP